MSTSASSSPTRSTVNNVQPILALHRYELWRGQISRKTSSVIERWDQLKSSKGKDAEVPSISSGHGDYQPDFGH
ncbi:uncharacterized protein A4U43_C05F3070 [Asparagus officinalis]|uniref:Uncharacterized protein n=1 Tax=Asparagus officinalis TaxID=4686 RepID=A0A5P1ENY7_ASPOF|nr:uncharacterized protein A4U43_C05F3070 [Asparagus officinalis]